MHAFLPVPFPLYALSAETHFRFFRGQPSLLFRRFPEVLFDMPRRLAPGRDLPVVLVLNDIDRFPATVESVALTVSQGGGDTRVVELGDGHECRLAHCFDRHCAVYLFMLPRSELRSGLVHVNGKATVRAGTHREHVLNDNFAGSSRLAMSCVVADEPLPAGDRCVYGDMHVHSQFSESHVEFGLPFEAIEKLTAAYGLRFVAITDHSYDLSTDIENHMRSNPAAPRWELLHQEMARHTGGEVLMLPGEEVSCLNAKGKVVHLCGIGVREFVPGSLDGARRGRRREEQLSITEAIERIHAQGGIAYAAHPGARAGMLQRLLLSRGIWHPYDITGALDGFQASNGDFDGQWVRGRHLWLASLRRGERLPLLAGNDAHGDFNRYRCVKMPFLSIYEHMERHLGFVRTGVYGRIDSRAELYDALRAGRTFVTSGPYLALTNGAGERSVVGETVPAAGKMRVEIRSSAETGAVEQVRVNALVAGEARERVLLYRSCDKREHTLALPLPTLPGGARYVRAECVCVNERGMRAVAACSPCYVER